MAVWEIRPGDLSGRPGVVAADSQDLRDRVFSMDGQAKDLAYRPPVKLFNRALKKNQRAAANVMPFTSGTFVLDAKARAAIGGFLSRFGELVELHHGSETLYLFNCTNLVDCIDEAATERGDEGILILEAIDESRVPTEPAVFKDPKTVRVRNYVNDAGREVIERWASEAGLTGLSVVPLLPL